MRRGSSRLNGSPRPEGCFRRSHTASCGTARVGDGLLAAKVFGQMVLLGQQQKDLRVSQQFVTLNFDSLPSVQSSWISSQEGKNIITKLRYVASCLGASDLDNNRSVRTE